MSGSKRREHLDAGSQVERDVERERSRSEEAQWEGKAGVASSDAARTPSMDKSSESAPAGDKSSESAPSGEKSPERKTSGSKTSGDKASAGKSSGKKKAKRGRSGALAGLAIVLALLLVTVGLLMGYGLGRTHGGREPAAPEAEVSREEELPPYDAFVEAMTHDNQEALSALSGADAPADEDASALLGEESFFGEDGEAVRAESVVVAEFGDGQKLMSDDVLETYNEELSSFIFSGTSEEEAAETVLDDVLHTMVTQRVLEQHAREMGIYELTDEDRAQIEDQAAQRYEEYLTYCIEHEINTEGMSAEEANGAAKSHLMEHEGVTLDSLRAELEAGWWERKLYDALTGDVRVDDAQVQQAYASQLEEQKASFTEYPDDYEFRQRNGDIILFNLPGYRAVKMLLLGFDDPEAEMAVYAMTDGFATADGEASEGAPQTDPAALDAYYAGPEARARQALELLRGGADMDELILTIGSDEGMRDERLRATGYYVCADSMLWSADFVRAAMALEQVGEYSEPVRVDDGVCILQYLGEVPEGEVPLESVREELTQEVLSAAREDSYSSQVQAWMDEANPHYYPERMQ